MKDKIYPIFLGISEAPIQRTVGSRPSCAEASEGKHYAEASRDDSERMRLTPWMPATSKDWKRWQNKPARIPRLPGTRRRRLRCAWHGVNWDLVFEGLCWAAVVGCLIYLGVVVFAPFALRFIWE